MLNWQRKKEQNFHIVFTFFGGGGGIGLLNPVIKGHYARITPFLAA
jgi:hypothetical protein